MHDASEKMHDADEECHSKLYHACAVCKLPNPIQPGCKRESDTRFSALHEPVPENHIKGCSRKLIHEKKIKAEILVSDSL
jgi:hypothetical protein